MVERVDEVGPVEVGVDPEHLTEDDLAHFHKVLGETAPFTDPVPVAWARQLREWGCGDGGIMSKGDSVRVSREDAHVVNLTRDPALHEGDVLVSW